MLSVWTVYGFYGTPLAHCGREIGRISDLQKPARLIGRQSPASLPLTQILFDSVENARLVGYKMHRLKHHLTISGHTLNHLRRLGGLLLDESYAAT
jgi:hypothetical protein